MKKKTYTFEIAPFAAAVSEWASKQIKIEHFEPAYPSSCYDKVYGVILNDVLKAVGIPNPPFNPQRLETIENEPVNAFPAGYVCKII